jgi:hypothetical protein
MKLDAMPTKLFLKKNFIEPRFFFPVRFWVTANLKLFARAALLSFSDGKDDKMRLIKNGILKKHLLILGELRCPHWLTYFDLFFHILNDYFIYFLFHKIFLKHLFSQIHTMTMQIKFPQQHCSAWRPKKPYPPAGVDPGIFCSGGGRDDHCATPPGLWRLIYIIRQIVSCVGSN